MKTAVSHGIHELCLFRFGDLHCAIDISNIMEISVETDITHVHGADGHIAGVANLRGHIVTIIDLRKKLDLPPAQEDIVPMILIVEDQGEKTGFLVDEIDTIIEVDPQLLDTTNRRIQGLDSHFYSGVYQMPGQLVAILNTCNILKREETDRRGDRDFS